MASQFHSLVFLCLLLPIVTAKTSSFRPKALLLPVTKDPSTLQYITQIHQRTPQVPVKLTVDLGGGYLWLDCETNYVSSTYKPSFCGSAPCSLAKAGCNAGMCPSDPKPGCFNNTCLLPNYNSVLQNDPPGDVGRDIVSIKSTNGFNPGKIVSIPKLIFSCAGNTSKIGLANGVEGIAGLGRTKVGLPSQFSAAFSFHRKFAICLSSSNGVIFFGNEPYVFLPRIDVSKSLIHTPLILNPRYFNPGYNPNDISPEYYIGVKSIKINGKAVSLNTTLLSIDRDGIGGTRISTFKPYTVLETSIYKAVSEAFVKAIGNKVRRVAAVDPFGTCFSSKNIGSTRVGPAVPQIDLVLQNEEVFWRIFGANSMVRVNDDVLCLGFVDAGEGTLSKASIVIGGHQLEDNLLQFDLATSRLAFSSPLLFRQTNCSNFNFTSIA
ncbi:hypothetical protein UlMin_009375 [Ulmus minor]